MKINTRILQKKTTNFLTSPQFLVILSSPLLVWLLWPIHMGILKLIAIAGSIIIAFLSGGQALVICLQMMDRNYCYKKSEHDFINIGYVGAVIVTIAFYFSSLPGFAYHLVGAGVFLLWITASKSMSSRYLKREKLKKELEDQERFERRHGRRH